MTLETLDDVGHDFTTPRFSVEVGATTLEETSGLVSSVRVDKTIDGADHFSLSLAPRFDFESGAFIDFSLDDFPIGESVEIEIGYGTDLETVLVGSIQEQGTDFPASGTPRVTVSGYGRYHDLTTGVVEDHWEDRTDSEIVEALADEYGLDADVDDTSLTRATVENESDSDAAFLEEKLAPRNDDGNGPYEVFTRLEELVFRAPRDDRDSDLELTYGASLQSFSPTYTETQSPARVIVRHWDPRRKAEIQAVAESEEGGSGERVVRRPVESEAAAERIANAILHEGENDRLEGNGETVGLPDIDIGQLIELSGLTDHFSGTYYVTDVTHTIDTGGYTTTFDVRLPNGAESP